MHFLRIYPSLFICAFHLSLYMIRLIYPKALEESFIYIPLM